MHHFFVEPDQVSEKSIRITGPDVNHMKNVLRMKIGEEVLISCQGQEEYLCRLAEFQEDFAEVSVLEKKEGSRELPTRIYLFQGLPKADKMELIIQKAVELGVYQIIPVSTKRAVVKLDEKKEETKRKRWNAISESAAKQSKRMLIPQVSPVMSFSEALSYSEQFEYCFIPYELSGDMEKTRELLMKVTPGSSVAIFIGPEGGFEETEITKALDKKVIPITLGSRILRTETAGLFVLSVLSFCLEP